MKETVQQERITYESRKASYNLDSSRVFEVVDNLETYLYFAKMEADDANPGAPTPSVNFRGKGRELVVGAEVVNEPGFLTSFDLATLVLSEDGKNLTLNIKDHPRVAINPQSLYEIAERYKL